MLRAAVLALTIGLAGCGASRPGWLGGTPSSAPVAGETFYASVGGLPVHEDASGTSAVVGRLMLHERVTRSEVAHGYAHVVGASGVTGWVDNAKLAWRLPQAGAAPSAAGTAPATGSPATRAPSAPTPSATAATSGVPAAPPTPARASTAESASPSPSAAEPAATEAGATAAPSPASAPSVPTAVPAAATDTPPPTTPPARKPPRPYDPF